MGLGGQTGNGMNWKAFKVLLGQSVLLVMWAIVLTDCLPIWTWLQVSSPRCISLSIQKSLLPDSLTDLPSLPTATKADGFALYFLGECNNVSVQHSWPMSDTLLHTSVWPLLSLSLFPVLCPPSSPTPNRVYVCSHQPGPRMALRASFPSAPLRLGRPSLRMLQRLVRRYWWKTSQGYGHLVPARVMTTWCQRFVRKWHRVKDLLK